MAAKADRSFKSSKAKRQAEKLRLARERLVQELPAIYDDLVARAHQGVSWATRLLLEHIERLQEQEARERESVITFTWSTPKASSPAASNAGSEDDDA